MRSKKLSTNTETTSVHANGVAVLHMDHGTNRQNVQGALAGVDKTADGQGEQQGERQGIQQVKWQVE